MPVQAYVNAVARLKASDWKPSNPKPQQQAQQIPQPQLASQAEQPQQSDDPSNAEQQPQPMHPMISAAEATIQDSIQQQSRLQAPHTTADLPLHQPPEVAKLAGTASSSNEHMIQPPAETKPAATFSAADEHMHQPPQSAQEPPQQPHQQHGEAPPPAEASAIGITSPQSTVMPSNGSPRKLQPADSEPSIHLTDRRTLSNDAEVDGGQQEMQGASAFPEVAHLSPERSPAANSAGLQGTMGSQLDNTAPEGAPVNAERANIASSVSSGPPQPGGPVGRDHLGATSSPSYSAQTVADGAESGKHPGGREGRASASTLAAADPEPSAAASTAVSPATGDAEGDPVPKNPPAIVVNADAAPADSPSTGTAAAWQQPSLDDLQSILRAAASSQRTSGGVDDLMRPPAKRHHGPTHPAVP